jgi:single-stranded DNA-binding protein
MVRIIPTKAAGDVLNSCTKGANLLIGGRLYRNRAVQGDFNSYLIPTKRIELLSSRIPLNEVTIAGAYWLNDNDIKANQTSKERHNFTILTSAPQQPLLNHEYDDTISFSVTSWKYDAERILQTAHKGRQLIVEGYLRSYNGYVSVTVRNGLVEMFGKKKDKENKIVNKSDSASKVVIQGESKEEPPI